MYINTILSLEMKKILIPMLALLIFAACQESLEERCQREARDYTAKNCPLPVGENVVMDSMTFDAATHTIAYIYTLSGVVDDTAAINRSNPRESLLKSLKNTPHLKLYKEAGYSFRYTYYSAKQRGQKLFDTTFREKDYQ